MKVRNLGLNPVTHVRETQITVTPDELKSLMRMLDIAGETAEKLGNLRHLTTEERSAFAEVILNAAYFKRVIAEQH